MKIIYYLWYIHSAQPNTEQELSVNLYICESINASLPMLRKHKMPMGHIAHLRKQFKSINTYDYIITLIKRKKNINFMIMYCFFIWILTQGCFVPKLVEIGSVVLEKIFFISSMYFRYFCNNLPLEMGWVLYLNNLNPLHPRMHCDKFGWKWPSGSGEEDF